MILRSTWRDDNDDTLTRATERSIQSITSTVPIAVEQPSQSYDKFTEYPDLKPKYLGLAKPDYTLLQDTNQAHQRKASSDT